MLRSIYTANPIESLNRGAEEGDENEGRLPQQGGVDEVAVPSGKERHAKVEASVVVLEIALRELAIQFEDRLNPF